MTPFDMIAATWRKRSTRILTPFVALALSPVILFLILGVIAVHVALAGLDLLHRVEYSRPVDRLRLFAANATAYAHSRWQCVVQFTSKQWRNAVRWVLVAPLIVFVALPLVLIEGAAEQVIRFTEWSRLDLLARYIGHPLDRWQARE